ncbi:MAG: KilA-N domain-containing protein [Polaribacter sp.]|nr:KilA-N domain-containing protein [Polaribacter sp.]
MSKNKKQNIIEVKGTTINVFHSKQNDFISLTDIAKTKENDSRAADVIKNWIRTRSTIELIVVLSQFTKVLTDFLFGFYLLT